MNSIKINNPKSNIFDLSHDGKISFKMGYLIPSPPIDCVPGDSYRLGAQSLIRFAPLLAPVMHRFDVRHEYFFVPKRLLWSNYEKWFTQTEVAGSLPAFPYINVTHTDADPANLNILNYMGIPNATAWGVGNTENINAMPLAAVQFIWNEYYRDQNLHAPVAYELSDGNNASIKADLIGLRKRCWEKDYFTSCLPNAQKGDPVMIPIGSQRVILDPDAMNDASKRQMILNQGTYAPLTGQTLESDPSGNLQGDVGGSNTLASLDPNGSMITEDSGEATSINDLRLAYALQRVKEKLMRGGSRMAEYLRAMYGVTPEDSRLDRPEYITGVKAPVSISEVLNTTGTEDLPQGNMAGHGVSAVSGNYGSYYVKEPGFIICMTSVIPRTAYQQGIDALWLKTEDPTQEYNPDMAHIGEQTVRNKEIYAFQGASGNDDFGYQVRFGEYKQMKSYVAGDFQGNLDYWHDGRIFAVPPALNDVFVECTPDSRIFAVESITGADHIYAHIYHEIKAMRKMPKFSTPI